MERDNGRGSLLLLGFFAFCFVCPVQALLNSTPQRLARDPLSTLQQEEAQEGQDREGQT